jgi:hypothetical protein
MKAHAQKLRQPVAFVVSRVTNHRILRHSFRIAQSPEIFGKFCTILRRIKLGHFFMNMSLFDNFIRCDTDQCPEGTLHKTNKIIQNRRSPIIACLASVSITKPSQLGPETFGFAKSASTEANAQCA